MPNFSATIQTEFVVEVMTETQTEEEVHDSGELLSHVVDQDEFIKRFKQYYPESQDDPVTIWDEFFGNLKEIPARSTDPFTSLYLQNMDDGENMYKAPHKDDGQNKEVRFLTDDSCHLLLRHYKLFSSGFDFNHLPSGFFLTKNPQHGGVRDVLHYSDFHAKKHPQKSPLAVILSSKEIQPAYERPKFASPQLEWYEFLRSKIKNKDVTYCTEEELAKAFIDFSNKLAIRNKEFSEAQCELLLKKPGDLPTQLMLEFNQKGLASLKETLNGPVNPIVLLGRWDTLLTQPNLKKEDLGYQWQALPQLKLDSGYGALRAMSDYQHTANPCGFLLPEMFDAQFYNIKANATLKQIFTKLKSRSYEGISSYKEQFEKYTELWFWRYIAYQPQRNSIEFYKKAWQCIEATTLSFNQKLNMMEMVAGSTTGRAHHSHNAVEEQKELDYWQKLCVLVDGITTASASMMLISRNKSKAEMIKNNFIHHLCRLEEYPSLPFFHSIGTCITDHIKNANPIVLVARLVKGEEPLKELVALSDKLNRLIRLYGADFFEGARFYFVEGLWKKPFNVQKYVELQYYMAEKYGKGYVPYLSTFNIKSEAEVDTLPDPTRMSKGLMFCLSLFRDADKQCSTTDLSNIIKGIGEIETDIAAGINDGQSLLPFFEHIASHFAAFFPENYFSVKRRQLTDAEKGLNAEQKLAVRNLHLPEEQAVLIISIESALVCHDPAINSNQLNQLNEQFVTLSRTMSPADFTQLLKNIDSLREQLPLDPSILGSLLLLISKQRSVESFGQIYYRNLIEKCRGQSVINKFIFFMETLKPLGKKIGPVSSLTVQDFLADVVLNCDLASLGHEGFITKVKTILSAIESVTMDHPHLQQHLFDALSNLAGKNTSQYLENLTKFTQSITEMAALLKAGEDANAQQNMLEMYTLFASFYQQPMKLTQLWDKISTLKQPEQQKFILGLIKNNKNIEGFDALITTLSSKPELFSVLVSTCSKPPFPDMNTMSQWLETNSFKQKYELFSKRPFGERRLDFAFNRREFAVQAPLFKGIDTAAVFTDELATSIDVLLKKNRTTSIDRLREKFLAIQTGAMPIDNQKKLELLCICIEMLARTTAQYDHGTPPKLISQELNTTQVMAMYAQVTHSKSRLISEVDTGEGKSRMNMLHAAFLVGIGKTVDFITSDLPLAERDFLTYNAFFSALGIRSSLISLSTPKQLYQKGGVNFSDNGQLLLLRNRSDIQLEPFAFLDEDPKRRGAIIDEADKFMRDKAKDSYNYAATSKTLKEFIWIYPLLVNFVREQNQSNPHTSFDAESLTNQFVDFVAIHDIDELHQANVAALKARHEKQLISWLKSAHTALQMKRDSDYLVTAADEDKLVRIRDAEGRTRYSRKVLVLDNGRPVEGSSFALGVHQCLCAIENQSSGKEEFVILPENETQRSSFPVTFMEQYKQGTLYGVSGTTRYAGPTTHSDINYEDYAYLVVPRQKALRRDDKKIWLAKDAKQQIEFIKRSLSEKLNKTPADPALLICANDEQSKQLHDALMADPAFKALVKKCTRVHGLTTKDDEVDAIKQAGKEGTLTISTVGMFGRGVDINADNLFVISAYVPTFEDEIQIKGRTGRAGKKGEFRTILNRKFDPNYSINGNTYNIHNEINEIQNTMALNAVNQEEIGKLYADFLENIHQKFLTTLAKKPKFDQLELLQKWQTYLNNMQKAWHGQKDQLLEFIEKGNKNEFISLFGQFTASWEQQADFIEKNELFSPQKAETIYKALLTQKGFFKPERQAIKVQRKYDVADDGQATIYSSLFAQELAVLRGERSLFANYYAWKEGRGCLFPNLMALLKGERPLFANLRATIARLIAALKEWWTKETPQEQKQQSQATSVSDDYDKSNDYDKSKLDADDPDLDGYNPHGTYSCVAQPC